METHTILDITQSPASRIESLVHHRTNGLIRGLQVCIHHGVITLYGQTATFYAKQLATQAVQEAGLMLPLNNEISVG